MKKVKDHVIALLCSLTAWINMIFLAVLPVYEAFQDQLHTLQPYLPDNIYRLMGMFVVITNMYLAMRRKVKEHAAAGY